MPTIGYETGSPFCFKKNSEILTIGTEKGIVPNLSDLSDF